MKCKTCKEEIPSKFAHALSVNICPLCGQEIMDTKLQAILAELKSAFAQAGDYMDQVEDWLLANYSFKKINVNESDKDRVIQSLATNPPQAKSDHFDAVDPLQRKGAVVRRSEEDEVDDVEEPTIFTKRAGVTINHRKAIDFIKGKSSMGAAHPSEFQGADDEYGDVESYNEGSNPLSKTEQREMASIFRSDESKINELEIQKLKRLQAQQAVGGGGGGLFRRG